MPEPVPFEIAKRRQALMDRFPTWAPSSLGSWLDGCAERFASRPLVVSDDRELTYVEVAEWADRLADGLLSLGLQPGDRIGLLMANFVELVPLKFAIAKVGAIGVPISPLFGVEELTQTLERSKCRALITMTGFSDVDYLSMLDQIEPGWHWRRGARPRLPLLNRIIQFSTDGRTRGGVMTVDELRRLGEENPWSADGVAIAPDATADIFYTPDTSGRGEGLLVTHDALLRTAFASAVSRAFGDGRRILLSVPCNQPFGYVAGLLAATVVGGGVILQTAFEPRRHLAGAERHGATDMLCSPEMVTELLECRPRTGFDLSALEAVLYETDSPEEGLDQRLRTLFGAAEVYGQPAEMFQPWAVTRMD